MVNELYNRNAMATEPDDYFWDFDPPKRCSGRGGVRGWSPRVSSLGEFIDKDWVAKLARDRVSERLGGLYWQEIECLSDWVAKLARERVTERLGGLTGDRARINLFRGVVDDPPETSSSVYQNSLQSEKVLLLRDIEELKSQISAMESQGDDSGAEDVGYRLEDKKKQLKKIEKKERKENNPDLLKFQKEPLDTMEQANIDISPSLQFQKAPPSTLEQEVVLLQGQLQELRSQEMFLESLEDESDVEERLEDLEFKIESTQLELVGLERKIRQEQEGKQSQERRSTSRDTDLKLSAPEGVGDAAVKVFYRREGVANIHGPMYEVKLSLLIFLRNLNRGAIFDLCTNLHEAGAVDDVVYKSVTNQVGGDEVEDIVFLQLKHRDVDKDKPMYLLKSDDSFGVMKYFLSYCEIERQMSEETDHPIFSGKLENCVFVMFTNGMLEADFLGKSKEAELDERIKEEIRIALRTTQNEGDVENIFNKLLKRITKWSEKQGIVSYLDNCSNFWPRFVRKVQMKRLNAQSVYLKNLTIKFEEDKIKTLSERTLSNPGAMCVVSEKGSLTISCLKIYTILSESDTKDCVFVDSKWLMVNLDYILSIWAGVWCTTLIILCNDHIPTKDVLEEIKRVLRSNSAARIVFVCSKDDTLPKTFGKNCVFLDEVYFSQLTVGSQDSVLGKKVTFQGHDVSIKSVIGTNSPDKYLKDRDSLNWKKSSNDISTIKKYINNESSETQVEIVNSLEDNLVLVIAEPGMDEIEQSDIDASTTKEFIFGSSKDKEDNSKGQLLEYFFGDFHNTIILMDSFDEISPDYSDKVCALIYEIRKSGVETLWVTSRPSMNNYLEDELSVLSYKMKPFSKDDQRKFLKTYWTLLVPSIEQDRLEVFIEELLGRCTQSLNDARNNFSDYGHLNIVKCLVDKGADINQPNRDGFNPLQVATRSGHLEVVHFLVGLKQNFKESLGEHIILLVASENGHINIVNYLLDLIDVNTVDSEGCTALHAAVRGGQLEVVQLLVKRNAHINCKDVHGYTALKYCVRNGRLDVLEFLVKNNGDINLSDENQVNLLHHAARAGQLENVKYLLRFGIDINSRDRVGFTALHHAIRNSNLHIVTYLTEAKADVNLPDNSGQSPLSEAAKYGKLDIVKYLFHNGAKVSMTDNVGCDVFLHATRNGRLNVVKYLFKMNANTCAVDKHGLGGLHFASINGSPEVVKYLVVKAFDVKASDKNGIQALHYAAQYGRLIIVKCLLEAGADINALDNDGRNVLIHASLRVQSRTVRFFILEGVDVNVRDNQGFDSLYHVVKNGQLNLVRFLFLAGKGGQPTTLPICSNAERSIKSEHIPSIQDNTKPIIGHVLPQLCQSVRNKRLDTFKDLLKDGGDINATDKTGRNVLHHVIKCGGLEFVRHIVDMGGNIKVQALNGFNALHYALRKGEIDVVQYLIQKGADVNAIDKNNYSLIHIAVRNERLDILQCLVKAGGNVNIVDKCGCCALHYAVQHGNISLVKCLVENHANIELPDPRGFRCIHFSSLGKNLEVVKYLIGQKADLGAKDIEGNTALHISAQQGCLEVVRCLVESEATIDTQNNRGQTALNLAKDNGHKDVVGYLEWRKVEMKGGRLILKYCSTEGDHVSVVSDDVYGGVIHSVEETLPSEGHDLSENNCVVQDGLPPLHRAARSGKIEAVKLAIREDADINLRDNKGFTALHHAVYSQEVDVLNVLLKMKAGCNIEDHKKRLPLHYAISKKSFAVVQCLVEGGSIVNAPDDEGVTALHLTARNGRFDYIKYLLQNGADVNLTDNKGLTALHCSTRNGTITNMMLLVSKDANFNAQDKSGLSALHHASISGRPKAVEYLVEMGVDLDILDRAGMTTFHHAVKHGRMEIVEFLAEKTGGRVDIHAVDGNGFSALHHAAKYGHLYLFQYLVNKDLDINLTDNKGFKAMHYAEINGHTKIVDFFSRIQVSDP
uniref:Uncharacterized protein n=1 Tax=Timema bartmani TaxID=61472 RepID=A0A7R9F416_9NEOP|nr:unnamed protein product [Timema bartmani]